MIAATLFILIAANSKSLDPIALASDSESLYVVDSSGTLYQASVLGGPLKRLVEGKGGVTGFIALSSGSVVYGLDGDMYKLAKLDGRWSSQTTEKRDGEDFDMVSENGTYVVSHKRPEGRTTVHQWRPNLTSVAVFDEYGHSVSELPDSSGYIMDFPVDQKVPVPDRKHVRLLYSENIRRMIAIPIPYSQSIVLGVKALQQHQAIILVQGLDQKNHLHLVDLERGRVSASLEVGVMGNARLVATSGLDSEMRIAVVSRDNVVFANLRKGGSSFERKAVVDVLIEVGSTQVPAACWISGNKLVVAGTAGYRVVDPERQGSNFVKWTSLNERPSW